MHEVRMKGLYLCCLLLILLILFSGCGTVKVPIAVTRPAEINMTPYKQIAIGRIEGNMGQAFSDGIKNQLVESSRFQVVERSRLDQIMKELNLSQSDLVDSKNKAQLGKLLGASAMITGRLNGKYDEKRRHERVKYVDKERGRYYRTHYYRQGEFKTGGSIDVVDIQTGQIIKSKALSSSRKDETSAVDATPDDIDQDALAGACLAENISTFIKAISPWVEHVQVPFETDSAIPDLEKGIQQAKLGEMQEAIRIFAAAARASETNAKIKPGSIAKAYWDLGLVYEYTWEFDKAIECFKKAYSLDSSEAYIKEIKNTEKLRAERKKLEQQGMQES